MMEKMAKMLHEDEPMEPAPDLDFGWLCLPRVPFMAKPSRLPPFFKVNQMVPWGVAAIMGFQHALAMLGGIVSVPLIVGGPFDAKLSNEEKEYLISAGLISSGILSLIQIYRLKLGDSGYYIGTGLVSVLGTSFTFVPIARTSIGFMMQEDSSNVCTTDADCTMAWANIPGIAIPGETNKGQCNLDSGFCKFSGQEAYGAFIGTCALCALLEIALSFVPRVVLRRAFPPIVCGICVLCIGVALSGVGIKYWGGGAFCADNSYKRMSVIKGESYPGDLTAVYESKSPCAGGACIPFKGALSGVCAYTPAKYDAKTNMTMGDVTTCERFKDLPGAFPAQGDVSMSYTKCTGNGQVVLPFGAAEYVGLGFIVFLFLILTEIFGSPFIRNCQVAIALLIGFAIAAGASYMPPDAPDGTPALRYVTGDKINKAPGITFLWVKTFPLSVYGPAVLPTLLAFIITTVESVGDITASAEASRVENDGQLDSRIQGGLLTDGIASLIGALFTVLPNTTFSQNNGVISLTRCANKRAGYMCCVFLILFGVIAKIAAIIASIPECVLGGMTSFLFANIVVSGAKILGPELSVRRNRFIVAASLSIAFGVALVPAWASNDLVRPLSGNANKFLGDTAVIILTTPYCIGTLLAMFFNAVIPYDEDEEPEEGVPLKSFEDMEEESLKPSEAPPPQMMPETAPIPVVVRQADAEASA